MKNRGYIISLALLVLYLFSACEDQNGSEIITNSISKYTVSFNADGGEPVPENQIVNHNDKVDSPAAMTREGFKFGGWYKEEAFENLWDFDHDVVTGNLTLYAKWNPPIIVPGADFAAKINWLNNNVQSDSIYTIEFYLNEVIDPVNFSFTEKTNITIILRGSEIKRIVGLKSVNTTYSMFNVDSGITLVLDNNLEINCSNILRYLEMINISSGGILIINNGVKIIGNRSWPGIGINILSGGTFIMNGGEISDIQVGVFVYGCGVFIMNDGEISANRRNGVQVFNDATFTMNGGKISDNSESGVYVSGVFIMNSGEISANSTTSYSDEGGGVFVDTNGTFTMNNGEIFGNDSPFGGGIGVKNGTFIMNDGRIYANASHAGGGVFVSSNATFTMNDGEIFENLSNFGGGIVVK